MSAHLMPHVMASRHVVQSHLAAIRRMLVRDLLGRMELLPFLRQRDQAIREPAIGVCLVCSKGGAAVPDSPTEKAVSMPSLPICRETTNDGTDGGVASSGARSPLGFVTEYERRIGQMREAPLPCRAESSRTIPEGSCSPSRCRRPRTGSTSEALALGCGFPAALSSATME